MNAGGGLILAGVDAATFLLCAGFIAYVVVILVPYLRHRPGRLGDGSQYAWHFIIPCLNEEAVVGRTVRHLATHFPQAHVWCVDDASSDRTLEILTRLEAEYSTVHVVGRSFPDAQKGKGPALNSGWAAIREWLPADVDADRVIVGVIDADGQLEPGCPDVIAGPRFFGDPQVGAVQIRVKILPAVAEAGRTRAMLVRLQDVEFGGVIAAMQMLRRHLGSVGMGGNGQFTRLSTLDRIARDHESPWHGSLLEDFELGLHVLLTGGRTEYCHDTSVAQEGLMSPRALVRQRSRWAQGAMQCFKYLVPLLASEEVSLGAALEITYFLCLPWIQLIGGVLYAVSGGVLAYWALIGAGGLATWWGSGAWGIIPLFLCFGLAPLVLWGPVYRSAVDRSLTRRHAWLIGLAHWPYIYIHHFATWRAFFRLVRAQHGWVKSARTASFAETFGPRAVLVSATFSTARKPETNHWLVRGRLVPAIPSIPTVGAVSSDA